MLSVRERILQGLLALLSPVATAHGATLARAPTVPTDRARLPALLLFPESETVRRLNDRAERELTLRLVALALGSANTAPDIRVDALMSAAHAALMADSTLGGLALSVEETDTEWSHDDADGEAVALSSRYRLTYRTFFHDLTQKG